MHPFTMLSSPFLPVGYGALVQFEGILAVSLVGEFRLNAFPDDVEGVMEPQEEETGYLSFRIRCPLAKRGNVELLCPQFARREPPVGALLPDFQPPALD